MTNKQDKIKDQLVGKFFHDYTKDGKMNHQGHILEVTEDGLYLVEYFSYLDGLPNGRALIKPAEVKGYSFYETDLEMRKAYFKANQDIFAGTFEEYERMAEAFLGLDKPNEN